MENEQNIVTQSRILNAVIPHPPKLDEKAESAGAQSFFNEAVSLISENVKGLPALLKNPKQLLLYIGLPVIWILLSIIPTGSALYKLVSPLIFLTASYNTVIGKAAYLIAVTAVAIPLISAVRLHKTTEYFTMYKRSFKKIKMSLAELKAEGIPLLLVTSGLGMVLANLISRNNKTDKYFACLLFGTAIFSTAGQVIKPRLYTLIQSAVRDVTLLLKGSPKKLHSYVNVSVLGLSLGLSGSIVGAFVNLTNSFYDYSCYLYGAVLVAAGAVLFFVRGKKNDNKAA